MSISIKLRLFYYQLNIACSVIKQKFFFQFWGHFPPLLALREVNSPVSALDQRYWLRSGGGPRVQGLTRALRYLKMVQMQSTSFTVL